MDKLVTTAREHQNFRDRRNALLEALRYSEAQELLWLRQIRVFCETREEPILGLYVVVARARECFDETGRDSRENSTVSNNDSRLGVRRRTSMPASLSARRWNDRNSHRRARPGVIGPPLTDAQKKHPLGKLVRCHYQGHDYIGHVRDYDPIQHTICVSANQRYVHPHEDSVWDV